MKHTLISLVLIVAAVLLAQYIYWGVWSPAANGGKH